ncbi:type IV toxin-antitoxin system AbiEi family antitoxin domain-containing protein [Legionella nagasakiensis]|uniref:type IV toxin-antitoxin system AbiEi family antitoxin domain-containing protein n=1 Tax=Legionella nagasakiensis TaxID=535290 RepID=UPI00105447F6|nr:type IV toxin-antitoxin system AbiEi family antitoxin [Legionella nagasakiensis]
MTVEQFFYDHPVFRYEEFALFKSEHGAIKSTSVNTALTYYAKSGRIKPIRRKLYAVVPPNQSVDSVSVDPYLVAGKATQDAVIGYHSALELLGVAYSSFGQLTYVTEQKSKPFEFVGHWYQSVAVPKALQQKQATDICVVTINRQGVDIRVTNPARTFVDVLDRVELCGGWEEVFRSISSLAVLNIDQVIDYCLMLNNSRLNAKVGYFLSQRQDAFAVTEQQLSPLLAGKPKVAQYIPGAATEQFQLVKPWNIYLPLSVINQSWEEPDAEF